MSENAATIWLPTDPPRQAPHLLTEAELISFLRLESLGVKSPSRTLTYWRMRGWLKSVKISRGRVYRLADAMALADRLAKDSEHPDLKPPTAAFGKNRPRRKVKP